MQHFAAILLRNSRKTDSLRAAKSAEFAFCLGPRSAAFALLIGILTVFVGTPGGAFAATSPARNGVPAQASDSMIAANLRAKLVKSKIGADGFKFHVEKGVVTWEGHTNVPQHKGAATRMAHTAGALQVINKIEVSAAGKAKASASLHRAAVTNQ